MALGHPDYQNIVQWVGAPLLSQTAYPIGNGTHDFGLLQLSNYASILITAKPTVAGAIITVTQTIGGAPSSLAISTTVSCPAGIVTSQGVVLLGNVVDIQVQGGNVNSVIDFAVIPANNITSSSTVGGSGVPSGVVEAFAGASIPAGYVLCDGTTYDGTNATYVDLWNAIGTTYGGSGQSAFSVPDLRGRVIVAKGTNGSVSALATNDGVAVGNRRPQHRHTVHHHKPVFTNAIGAAGTVGVQGVNNSDTFDNADGGSGVSTDSLDGPAFLVLNYIIKL